MSSQSVASGGLLPRPRTAHFRQQAFWFDGSLPAGGKVRFVHFNPLSSFLSALGS